MDIDEKTGLTPGEDRVITLKPLAQAGAGATVVAVTHRRGDVVLQFPIPVEWCALDPQTAVMVAEAMARAAHVVRFGREPPPNADVLAGEIKKKATEIIRQKMINRTVLLLRNFLEKKPPLDYQATEIVNRILQEVT